MYSLALSNSCCVYHFETVQYASLTQVCCEIRNETLCAFWASNRFEHCPSGELSKYDYLKNVHDTLAVLVAGIVAQIQELRIPIVGKSDLSPLLMAEEGQRLFIRPGVIDERMKESKEYRGFEGMSDALKLCLDTYRGRGLVLVLDPDREWEYDVLERPRRKNLRVLKRKDFDV